MSHVTKQTHCNAVIFLFEANYVGKKHIFSSIFDKLYLLEEILRLSERDGAFCTIARVFKPMAVKFTSS